MLFQSTQWGQCVSDTHWGPDCVHLDTQKGHPQVLLPGSAALKLGSEKPHDVQPCKVSSGAAMLSGKMGGVLIWG